jgi:hypothetical protein
VKPITNTVIQKLETALLNIKENVKDSDNFDIDCLIVAIDDEKRNVQIRRAMNLANIGAHKLQNYD